METATATVARIWTSNGQRHLGGFSRLTTVMLGDPGDQGMSGDGQQATTCIERLTNITNA